jgi:cell division protein ZapD
VITYEYPLNERIRTLLRLEALFERANHFLAKDDDSRDHHAVLLTLFEIIEVASRADLKSELLQELERQKQVLLGFRNNPQIAENVLKQVISDIERTSAALFAMTGKIGQHVRENEWLMSIKQRIGIPGGACEFDLPSYHFWLNRDGPKRNSDLQAWFSPLLPIKEAAAIVLKLLREGGRPIKHTAHRAVFSQMLGGKTSQMVRIRLPRASVFIPEISANRYALNVRFGTFGTKVCEADVEFELTFCNL